MSKKTTTQWLKGLAAAAISGGATAVTLLIADPHTFNFGEWRRVLSVAAMAAAVGVALYLKQSPVPPCDPPARKPGRRRTTGAVLLALALTSASACGGNLAPKLVAVEDATHDALKAAQDGVEAICAPGLLPSACRDVKGALVPAWDAQLAFNRALRSERLAGVGVLIEKVGELTRAVANLPPSAIRQAVMKDLQRLVDEAFKGAR